MKELVVLLIATSFVSFSWAEQKKIKKATTENSIIAGRVYFVEPGDGAKVKSPLKVRFMVEGMAVKPAGTMEKATGHHHLIIDGKPIKENEVVPTDDKHLHFGKGQTETEVKLEKGEHTLTLQFADGAHRSYGPAYSTTIKVIVE